MKYRLKSPVTQPGNGNGHSNGHAAGNGNGHAKALTRVLTGRNLAHSPRTKTERALLAASIARGDVVVTKLTLTQASQLAGVNITYAKMAARLTAAERFAVEAGRRTLYDKTPAPGATCDDGWHRMSPSEQKEWVRDHAPELWSALDAATSPQPAVEEAEVVDEESDPFADFNAGLLEQLEG
jgi:hypothetical protein